MNKFTKEKREKIVVISGVTSVIVMGLYFMVICSQRELIAEHETRILSAREAVEKAERWRRMAGTVRQNLEAQRVELSGRQEKMAPADKFNWFYNTFEGFRAAYDVNLLEINKDPELGEAGLLPRFPYTAATFAVKLGGTYHDFGRFLADFESEFPFMRVQNVRLELDPMQKHGGTNEIQTATATAEAERLAISMKVVTLVKPATPL